MATIRSVPPDTVVGEGVDIPYTDLLSAVVVDDAVATLARLRQPGGGQDPRARLSCLVSLASEVDARVEEAVGQALDQGCSWDDVADALAETTTTLRCRYDPVLANIGVDDVPVPPAAPVTDEVSADALQEAVTSVVLQRFPLSLFDRLAVLNALVSLCAQAHLEMHDAVADARDQGHRWGDIAMCLAVSPKTARRRYAAHARNRPEAPFGD
jgi:hypothetical protein